MAVDSLLLIASIRGAHPALEVPAREVHRRRGFAEPGGQAVLGPCPALEHHLSSKWAADLTVVLGPRRASQVGVSYF